MSDWADTRNVKRSTSFINGLLWILLSDFSHKCKDIFVLSKLLRIIINIINVIVIIIIIMIIIIITSINTKFLLYFTVNNYRYGKFLKYIFILE